MLKKVLLIFLLFIFLFCGCCYASKDDLISPHAIINGSYGASKNSVSFNANSYFYKSSSIGSVVNNRLVIPDILQKMNYLIIFTATELKVFAGSSKFAVNDFNTGNTNVNFGIVTVNSSGDIIKSPFEYYSVSYELGQDISYYNNLLNNLINGDVGTSRNPVENIYVSNIPFRSLENVISLENYNTNITTPFVYITNQDIYCSNNISSSVKNLINNRPFFYNSFSDLGINLPDVSLAVNEMSQIAQNLTKTIPIRMNDCYTNFPFYYEITVNTNKYIKFVSNPIIYNSKSNIVLNQGFSSSSNSIVYNLDLSPYSINVGDKVNINFFTYSPYEPEPYYLFNLYYTVGENSSFNYTDYNGTFYNPENPNGVKGNSDLVQKQEEMIEQQKEANETSKGIFQTLKDMLSYINPFSENFFVYKLIELLIEGLKSLFIPADDFFGNWFADLNNSFKDQFGIVYYPVSCIIDFLNTLNTKVSETEPIIHIPEFSFDFMGASTVFFKEYTYNFNSLLVNDNFKRVHNLYLFFVNIIFTVGLIVLAGKIGVEIFGGVGDEVSSAVSNSDSVRVKRYAHDNSLRQKAKYNRT